MLFVLAFLVISERRGGGDGDTVAVLGVFAYAALRLLPSVNRIVLNLGYLRFGSAAVQVVTSELALVRTRPPRAAEPAPLSFELSIRLEDVSIRYTTSGPEVLQHVDLEVPKGSSLGIVGPTGGGKTTIVDLLLGLLPPSAGRVSIDGVDVHENERAWQQLIGLVPQSIFIVDDTLRRNVALGTDDDAIDEACLREAIELAQLEDLVASLPDGLDTTVGENGSRLSGGQRQRVAIARALYRHPQVLIFDEGTSALDPITEADLVVSLENLRERHTLIAVAHRLTTVRACDQIIVVRYGGIAARGTYDELLIQDPSFRRMAGGVPLPGVTSGVEAEAEG
jgi:ABC-type multidrug transport system fused ATPase/permease subunit